jgi:transposase
VINERYFLSLYSQGARAVLRYIEQLEKRITDAEARVTRSQQSLISRLSKELARAKAMLAGKTAQLIGQQQLNHQLRARIRELEREVERGTRVERDSHNSSLPPSLDEAEVVEASRRQVFDLPPVKLVVTEHRRETRRCAARGAKTQAEFPPGLRAPAQYGPGLLARSAYLTLYQLLPAARTSEALRDLFNFALPPATIQRASRFSSGKLVRSEQRRKAAIRDSLVVGADETGLRVAGSGGWVHVARTDELTHFAYDSRRGLAAMQEIGILRQFRGTLVRDGYLSYSRFEQCRHSLCNAHPLRESVFVAESDPAQAVWAKPLATLLLEIKESASEARAAGQAQLSEKVKDSYLRRHDRLVKKADKLNPQPREGEDSVGGPPQRKRTPLTPARRLVNRLLRRRGEVLCFMSNLAVPFTNNGAERDLRMVKVQQKVGGCFRTAEGARDFCRVRSYLSTARKQGYPLPHALVRVLNGKPLVFSPAAGAS